MLVSKYHVIVKNTEQFSHHDFEYRKQISLYGLVGEIGSLTSAVKKAKLANCENAANDEVIEEIGDVFWYLFNLLTILDINGKKNILKKDILHVRNEVTESSERGERIRAVLTKFDEERVCKFLDAAKEFLKIEDVTFNQYQTTAYLTARTEGNELVDVCLAVLWQLGAELLRNFTMPKMELYINTNIITRDPETVIGEIAWHLAAIASVLEIDLDNVIEENVKKARFRTTDESDDNYFDGHFSEEEQLPRKFEISFVSTSSNHARMYYHGRPLGDDLTDNSYFEDGYRYHDVMHLANAACLRWSPVLRGFLKKKRKSCPKTDEVEDGARAQIVEELVIKAIHAEGTRLSPKDDGNNLPLFPEKGQITFRLIKTLVEYVKGLEVEKSHEWEWREAIYQGAQMYHKLRQEGQGTVTVNLDNRSLSFDSRVYVGIKGVVREIGTSTVAFQEENFPEDWVTAEEREQAPGKNSQVELIANKKAILNALGFFETDEASLMKQVTLSRMDSGKYSVKTTGSVRKRRWEMDIIEFKLISNPVDNVVVCTALGLADPKDTTR